MRHVLRHMRCRTTPLIVGAAGCMVLFATVAGVGNVAAQTFPSRPITIIVAFPAGGPSDTPARLLAERMRVSLGQSVIVENISGASGSTGTGRVARAAGDGHTLVLGNQATHVINSAMMPLPYDVVNDFAPVSLLSTNSQVIVARKTLPANNLKELIAWLKANPDKATFGTSGVGSIMHLSGVLLQKETGTRFGFVPYRGVVPTLQDLVAGQIDMSISQDTNALPLSRAGSIKGYAVASPVRLQAAPEIPTVDEAGLPGFHVPGWFGLFAPKGTPAEVIARLNAAVADTLADPEARARLADLGHVIPPREQQTPEALAAIQKDGIAKWWPIIKAANLKAE
jgi:tripartite-type tricarboxylate transporter receptor subunit TctC